jgi:hypothetical protein
MGVSHRKVVGDEVIVMRRDISALIEVVMKKGFLSSQTVLYALAR